MSTETAYSWGGLLETIYENCSSSEESPKKIRILRRKIKRLEESKTIEDIQHSLHFTKMERNYLNSPLLDEIFETIFSKNPVEISIEKDKLLAFLFYTERSFISREERELINYEELINYNDVIQKISENAAVKILRYLVEEKKMKINMERCFTKCYWATSEYDTPNDADIFMMFCLEKMGEISDDMIGYISEFYETSFEKMLDKINPINAEKMLYIFCTESTRQEKIKKLLEKFPNVSMERTLKAFVGDIYIVPGNVKILLEHGYCCEDTKLLKELFLSLFTELHGIPMDILYILKNKYRDVVDLETIITKLMDPPAVWNDEYGELCEKRKEILVEFIEQNTWSLKELNQGINMLANRDDHFSKNLKADLEHRLKNAE